MLTCLRVSDCAKTLGKVSLWLIVELSLLTASGREGNLLRAGSGHALKMGRREMSTARSGCYRAMAALSLTCAAEVLRGVLVSGAKRCVDLPCSPHDGRSPHLLFLLHHPLSSLCLSLSCPSLLSISLGFRSGASTCLR